MFKFETIFGDYNFFLENYDHDTSSIKKKISCSSILQRVFADDSFETTKRKKSTKWC